MKKQNKIQLLLIGSGILLFILLIYAGMRITQIARIHQQVSAMDAKEKRLLPAGADIGLLKDKFPARADISSFVESLYAIAQASGLENVEVTTANDTRTGSIPRKKGGLQDSASMLLPYRIKISSEGKYRSIAEYLRRMHEFKRYNKVVFFDMKPGENSIRTTIIVEIMSLEVQNAS